MPARLGRGAAGRPGRGATGRGGRATDGQEGVDARDRDGRRGRGGAEALARGRQRDLQERGVGRHGYLCGGGVGGVGGREKGGGSGGFLSKDGWIDGLCTYV